MNRRKLRYRIALHGNQWADRIYSTRHDNWPAKLQYILTPHDMDGWLALPLCWLLGHSPIEDRCGKPEHDFCEFCGRKRPGEAKR